MADNQHTTRRALLGGAPIQAGVWVLQPPPPSALVTKLSRQLTSSIARYEQADAAALRSFQETYPNGREAAISGLAAPEHLQLEILCALERKTGFEAACERLDHGAEHVAALIDRIMAVPLSRPGASALKARACLWEAPVEALAREGFGRVAAFLSELKQGA